MSVMMMVRRGGWMGGVDKKRNLIYSNTTPWNT